MTQQSLLPETVALRAGSRRYLSSSRGDIQVLASEIMGLTLQEQRLFFPSIFSMELMIPPLWVRAAVAMIRWRKKLDALAAWQLIAAQPKSEAVLIEMKRQTVNHILNGEDREDADSVGGWSQRELNFASNILAVIKNTTVRSTDTPTLKVIETR